MNRRGFLRGLGLLAGSALIPKEILPVTDFIEKKSVVYLEIPPGFLNQPFTHRVRFSGQHVQHMTIQRRCVTITGEANTEVIWVNCEKEPNCQGFIHLEDYENYKIEQERKILV